MTVNVDLSKGDIEWKINGERQFSYLMVRLKDKSINWVPLLLMERKGDCVEWL